MGYYNDPYSSPEKHGLVIVYTMNEPGLSYEFNEVVLWRRTDDGKLFWAHDSGCSCPSPFENYSGVADLSPLPETASDLELVLADSAFQYGDRLEFREAAGL